MREIVDKYKKKGYIVVHAGDYDNMNLKPLDEGQNPISSRFDREWIKNNIDHWVKGNHDFMVKRGIYQKEEDFEEFIFNSYKVFKIEKTKILLSHFLDDSRNDIYYGTKKETDIKGKDSALYYEKKEKFDEWLNGLIKKNKPNLIITGHTHIGRFWNMKGIDALNPGSLIYAKSPQPRGSYMVACIDKNKLIKVKMVYLDN